MAIDRIGKGGGSVEPPKEAREPGGATKATEASRPFEVRTERATQAAGAEAVGATGASPLERLRAGQIDVDGYVDLKLTEATAHLQGLPPAQLDSIRRMLRDQIATDPALVDLVKDAAGAAPSVPEE